MTRGPAFCSSSSFFVIALPGEDMTAPTRVDVRDITDNTRDTRASTRDTRASAILRKVDASTRIDRLYGELSGAELATDAGRQALRLFGECQCRCRFHDVGITRLCNIRGSHTSSVVGGLVGRKLIASPRCNMCRFIGGWRHSRRIIFRGRTIGLLRPVRHLGVV